MIGRDGISSLFQCSDSCRSAAGGGTVTQSGHGTSRGEPVRQEPRPLVHWIQPTGTSQRSCHLSQIYSLTACLTPSSEVMELLPRQFHMALWLGCFCHYHSSITPDCFHSLSTSLSSTPSNLGCTADCWPDDMSRIPGLYPCRCMLHASGLALSATVAPFWSRTLNRERENSSDVSSRQPAPGPCLSDTKVNKDKLETPPPSVGCRIFARLSWRPMMLVRIAEIARSQCYSTLTLRSHPHATPSVVCASDSARLRLQQDNLAFNPASKQFSQLCCKIPVN